MAANRQRRRVAPALEGNLCIAAFGEVMCFVAFIVFVIWPSTKGSGPLGPWSEVTGVLATVIGFVLSLLAVRKNCLVAGMGLLFFGTVLVGCIVSVLR